MTKQVFTVEPSDINVGSLELREQAMRQNPSVKPGDAEELSAAQASYRPQNEGPGSTRPPA